MLQKRIKIFSIPFIFLLIFSPNESALAKSPVRTIGRGAVRGIFKKINPRHLKKFGPLHIFRKDTKLIRFSDHPSIDTRIGLRPHSFWIRQRPGRYGNLEHIRRKLSISHPLKGGEKTIAKKGWRYHERPIKNGKARIREIILDKRVIPKKMTITPSLQGLSR